MRIAYTELFAGLEPSVVKQLNQLNGNGDFTDEFARDAMQHSIALSMKRIADTLAESLELAYAIRNNR